MSAPVQLTDGNLIVVAGAGAGKTYNLVQTCLARIHAGAGIDEILIVTFTKAAAAELRKRIGEALQKAFDARPDSAHLARQLALLDRAQISTLHSFCLELVSRHFSELGLSPRLSTLETAQAAALKNETLDKLFENYFEQNSDEKKFLLDWFKGDLTQVRSLIGRIHQFTQTRPNTQKWFNEQRTLFSGADPAHWRKWLSEEAESFVERWRPVIAAQPTLKNPARDKVLVLMDKLALADIGALYFSTANEVWPRGSKKEFRDPFKAMYDEAAALGNWTATGQSDPLLDDWNDSRHASLMLLRIAEEFASEFAAEKMRRGLVDFHDLEQFALRLLWNDGPTDCARVWQRRFKWIFVDEYQDINQAQDQIIHALGAAAGNRFLVGDVKQSIYGFRQADPEIFKRYQSKWGANDGGGLAYLSRNWRSHERMLHFVNGFFACVMRNDCGGVEYDENARLQFAEHPDRMHLSAAADPSPKVEVHLVEPDLDEDEFPVESESGDESPLAEMEAAEAEAEIIARWCQDAVAKGQVSTYGDIVILRRAAASAVESFAKVFSRRGIPFDARRSGFFACIEILDLTNLLAILDNPLQDIPLLGVLRSPFGGFSTDDLANIRAASATKPFFVAMRETGGAKTKAFLEKLAAWRILSRDTSLAERLETILEESGYEDWAAAQDRGAQRRANIRRLVELARQFDQISGEGLYPFLNYVEEQTKSVGDMAAPSAPSAGAVRLMTVHQSKGLQFPVVIVAGLGTAFNKMDFRGASLLDDEFGLCLKARPPGTRRQYETIAFHLAKRRQEKRLIDEEMRILYVALTRAENRLLLVGAPSKKACERWSNGEPKPTAASSMLDWLGPWLAAQDPRFLEDEHGQANDWFWRWHQRLSTTEPIAMPIANGEVDPKALADLKARIERPYDFLSATAQEAKSSATALRRAFADEPELARPIRAARAPGKLRANEAGQAAHRFMQHARFEKLHDAEAIQKEVRDLIERGVLTEQESLAIEPNKIASFWNSEFGKELLAQPLRRELRFTARFSRADLAAVGAPITNAFGDGEFIVVQGAADLVAILSDELWLVDFKTDRIPEELLAPRLEEYALQLRIYALALSRIYKRPVTRACLRFLGLDRTEWIEL